MRFSELTPLKLLAIPAIPLAAIGIVALATHSRPAPVKDFHYCIDIKPTPAPMPQPEAPHIHVTA